MRRGVCEYLFVSESKHIFFSIWLKLDLHPCSFISDKNRHTRHKTLTFNKQLHPYITLDFGDRFLNLFTISRFIRQKALQISSFYSHDLLTRVIWLNILLASKSCLIRLQEQITGLLEQLKEEQRLRYVSIIQR